MSTTSSSSAASSPVGTLYLLPVTLGDDRLDSALPAEVLKLAKTLDTFVVENEKTARRFLSLMKTDKPVRELTLLTLNEHTEEKALPDLLKPLLQGHHVGIMSEAGCPGIADPGARLVELAHRKGIRVVPLVGPSSILLSLMASGLDGQRFSFHGYLPSDKAARVLRLKELERESQKCQQTQLFIETPYRNQHMLEDILAHCQGTTRLCVATNISLTSERIVTKTVSEWKRQELPDIQRQPTVFLLLAAVAR
ncbi:SAM-dependent methyltransferase [Methylovorus menthalis]|uniref:SAM-dependent methyltransferase n=1 Tax=Methylovorus menthalis TaxID=1002227 RepID=UPI001E367D23|nr:SAM-dependent methyltransferase [Methylovorus menthalis]MCB4811738.1 SAM-dependent methyltransferase [Methylovorus menthalis]